MLTKEQFQKLTPNEQKLARRWFVITQGVRHLLDAEINIAEAEGIIPRPYNTILDEYAKTNGTYSSRQGVRFAIMKTDPELLTHYRNKYAELKKKQSNDKRVVGDRGCPATMQGPKND